MNRPGDNPLFDLLVREAETVAVGAGHQDADILRGTHIGIQIGVFYHVALLAVEHQPGGVHAELLDLDHEHNDAASEQNAEEENDGENDAPPDSHESGDQDGPDGDDEDDDSACVGVA